MSQQTRSANWNEPADLSIASLAIAEHAPMAMVSVEGAGHIVNGVNPAFCRLLDKSRDQLIGRPIAEVLPENETCLNLIDRVFRTGEPESHTEQGKSQSHQVFWAYTLWPLVRNNRPIGVTIQVTQTSASHERMLEMNEALVRGSVLQHELTEASESLNRQLQAEIIERKQVELALLRAQGRLADHAGQLENLVAERTAELTATNKQLQAFAYSIAHDLRAPLRAMQAFSTLLAGQEGAGLSERGRNYADRINKSAQFMDAMLIDLLTFSRISQQRVELAPVNLETVVASALSHLQGEIQGANGRVESCGPWPGVLAHETTVMEILFNLVGNALKFVRDGVPPLVRLSSEERADFIRIWVEDNGIGIAPGHVDQIFGLFTRLEGEKYGGTGIGLAIVQKGVERMGGRVGVESIPGQGSRFWVDLRRLR